MLICGSSKVADLLGDYVFDPSLLREFFPGSNNLVMNSGGEPYFQLGTYDVDIFLNDKYQSSTQIELIRDKSKIGVCLSSRFYKAFAV